MAHFNDLNQTEVKKNEGQENEIFANSDLEVNRKNQDEYKQLMEDSKTSLDSYYDKNNIFVRLIQLGLLVFIIVGFAYYFLIWLAQ